MHGVARVVDYFDRYEYLPAMGWAVATRTQLDRWEPLVAAWVAEEIGDRVPFPAPDYWRARHEWHFLIIAARNLIGSFDLLANPPVLDSTIRDEIIEVRGVNEHWKENMPVFNVKPPPGPPPHRTGKSFAARNPGRSPFGLALNWNIKAGALVTPNVSASDLHGLIDRVQEPIVADHPELAEYVPARLPSPWLKDPRWGWFPRSVSSDSA